MIKPHQLRWAIAAPNAEVEKWRENFALENPLVLIEEEIKLRTQRTLIYCFCGNTQRER